LKIFLRAIIESTNLISIKPDLNFSSSVTSLKTFTSDGNSVPVIFDSGASLAIIHRKEDSIKPP